MVKIIFLVDDDEDDRDVFREALMTSNPDVDLLFAQDGLEALEILRTSWLQPDAIFLDYNMPRMNGVECLKQLKADKDTMRIPVIMYTTSGDRAQEATILKLGANYYMRKTHSFQQLCAELDRLLEDIAENHPKVEPSRKGGLSRTE